jgi:prepilin-type N-terminal cleavage/methylation domain-containing protein
MGQRTDTDAPYPRPGIVARTSLAGGFTLFELLVVLAILVVLLGMGIPAFFAIKKSSAISTTRSMVQALSAAIAGYQTKAWVTGVQTVPGGPWQPRTYRMWECNGDHLLDGDPAIDPPGILSAVDRAAVIASGYRGFVEMVQPTIPKRLIKAGHIVDPWGTPIRITYSGDNFYAPDTSQLFGTVSRGVWSAGPDRRDLVSGASDPTAQSDNITSWSRP